MVSFDITTSFIHGNTEPNSVPTRFCLWITDFGTVVLSQNIFFLNTTNLNSPLLMKQYSNDFKTFADKSNQSSHPYFVGQPSTNHVTRQYYRVLSQREGTGSVDRSLGARLNKMRYVLDIFLPLKNN